MSRISTKRSDVIWNYVGTIVSMTSGFILLPLLVYFLTDDELGLWYVYLAIADLAQLFEFGFNPTFARNIVYVVSGARKLTAKGCDFDSVEDGIDWHLLNTLIRASKLIYAVIAFVVFVLVAIIGSLYVAYIARDVPGMEHWVAWGVFCVAVFLNLYYLSYITVLRGYGDVAGENMAKTFSRGSQLVLSAVLLLAGTGLVGAAIGYLANGLLMRVFASFRIKKHVAIEEGRASDNAKVTLVEVRDVVSTIYHVAWRDGLVSLANYASTSAMSIVCSLFLGLAETGTYSVLMQFAKAVCSIAMAYPKSFLPAFQSRYAEGDLPAQKRIVSSGAVAYWVIIVVCTLGVALVVLPLLPLIKPSVTVDIPLYLVMSLYMALWQHHSTACCYIVSMNQIPYLRGYIVASVLGLGLSSVMAGLLGMGSWGIILGQALSQLVYNNWKWPMFLARQLDTKYRALLAAGVRNWLERLRKRRARGGGAS